MQQCRTSTGNQREDLWGRREGGGGDWCLERKSTLCPGVAANLERGVCMRFCIFSMLLQGGSHSGLRSLAQKECSQADIRALLLLSLRACPQNTGRLSFFAHPITHKTPTAHSRARAIHNFGSQRSRHTHHCAARHHLYRLHF